MPSIWMKSRNEGNVTQVHLSPLLFICKHKGTKSWDLTSITNLRTLAVEQNREARAIMANAQAEEFKHFGMDLEFLLRQKPKWRVALQNILFKEGDIVEHGEEAEEAENQES